MLSKMIGRRGVVSSANMAMRGTSLGARFALSLYMAHFLGLRDIGVFGMIAGVAGIAPPLLGFGVSYFINREAVAAPRQQAYVLLRDRFALSLAIALAAWILGAGLLGMRLVEAPPNMVPVSLIITIEFLSFELHTSLIYMQRAVISNFLLFLRSAAWVLPLIVLALFDARFRTFEVLLYFWLGGQVVNVALHVLPFRDTDVRAMLRIPIGWRVLLAQARRGPLIYLNDIAAAGQVYIDRFVIGAVLGVSAAGLYTLYFSLTNGLYVLVATASVQMAMPRISEAFRQHGATALPDIIRREVLRALQIAGVLAIVIVLTALVILPRLGFGVFATDRLLFVLMVIASFMKPVTDVLNTSLYAIGLDRELATVNLLGVAVSVTGGAVLTATIGLTGYGISAILTQIVMVAFNIGIISRFIRKRSAGRV